MGFFYHCLLHYFPIVKKQLPFFFFFQNLRDEKNSLPPMCGCGSKFKWTTAIKMQILTQCYQSILSPFISTNVHQHVKHLFVASSNLTGIKVLPVVYLSCPVEISFKSTACFLQCTKRGFHSFDSRAPALCCILCPLLSLREFVLSETITFLSRQRQFYFSTKPSHEVVVSIFLPRVSFHSYTLRRSIKLQHQESQTFSTD